MTFVYLILTLLLLSVMVVIHELGHFLFAKLFGVTVLEFSIGMGPVLYTTKKKNKDKSGKGKALDWSESFTREDESSKVTTEQEAESTPTEQISDESEEIPEKTVFSIRALPIGGFVSMAGEDKASTDKNAFCNQKVWKRLIITLAGPVMNLLLGFLCVCVLVGIDGSSDKLPSNVISYEQVDQAISSEWLMTGDEIIKINNVSIHTGNELDYEITNQGYEPVSVTVIRNGERITLEGVVFPTVDMQGITMGSMDFKVYRDDVTFSNIVKHALFRSVSMVKMIVDSIFDLIGGRYGADALSGPIGVSGVVGQAAKSGFYPMLYLFAFITINLGVFNLIPFPALDGGRIIFLAYEGIFRKPVKKEVEGAINTIGLMLLMGLAVIIMFKDLFALF